MFRIFTSCKNQKLQKLEPRHKLPDVRIFKFRAGTHRSTKKLRDLSLEKIPPRSVCDYPTSVDLRKAKAGVSFCVGIFPHKYCYMSMLLKKESKSRVSRIVGSAHKPFAGFKVHIEGSGDG